MDKGCETWYNGDMNRKCIDCGKVKPIEQFPLKYGNGYGHGTPRWRRRICKECERVKVRPGNRIRSRRSYAKRRGEIFREAVAKYGGKCKECGRSKPLLAFIFHHVNKRPPGEFTGKQFYRRIAQGKIRRDIWLMCANCHLILHRKKWASTNHQHLPLTRRR